MLIMSGNWSPKDSHADHENHLIQASTSQTTLHLLLETLDLPLSKIELNQIFRQHY